MTIDISMLDFHIDIKHDHQHAFSISQSSQLRSVSGDLWTKPSNNNKNLDISLESTSIQPAPLASPSIPFTCLALGTAASTQVQDPTRNKNTTNLLNSLSSCTFNEIIQQKPFECIQFDEEKKQSWPLKFVVVCMCFFFVRGSFLLSACGGKNEKP